MVLVGGISTPCLLVVAAAVALCCGGGRVCKRRADLHCSRVGIGNLGAQPGGVFEAAGEAVAPSAEGTR